MRLSALSALILCLFGAATVFSQKPAAEAYVKGELLIRFDGNARSANAVAAHRAVGASVVEELGDLGWQRVSLPSGMSVDTAIEKYKELPDVVYAQPNFYYHLLVTPNDAQFTNAGMYGLTKISAPSAWDLTTGSASVVVADIDTGLRYTHQDLAANSWVNPGEIAGNGVDDDANGFIDDIYGADFRFNDADPADQHGHGTHTAGTIGAVGNNVVGVVGVNWTVKIMAIKIYSASGTDTTSAMLVNAYNYVRAMRVRGVNVRVTNNSYGGCNEACGYDQATKDAIDAMGDAGILNVFAAGNSNTNNDVTPFYPATYVSPSVISVASSTNTDAKSSFSSFGLTTVDLAAPGSGIYSTTFGSDTTYGTMSGTSMATPHVAGAAALLSAFNPNLSVASLKATLMSTVDVLPAWSTLVKTGGRLNVDRALRNQTVCGYDTGASSMTVPTKGGIFTVNVTSPANCDYSVKSNVNWIKISSSNSLSGNGSVTFRVPVNPTISRTGTISIGGQTFTVIQRRN